MLNEPHYKISRIGKSVVRSVVARNGEKEMGLTGMSPFLELLYMFWSLMIAIGAQYNEYTY